MQGILIIATLIALSYIVYRLRQDVTAQLWLAFSITLAWVVLSTLYVYEGDNYYLWGLNLFPLVLWTAGLTFYREIYEWAQERFGAGWNTYGGVVALYLVVILVIEFVGYNLLDIQLASTFPGLFGMELLHLPWWGMVYYLTVGPLYLLLTDYLEVR